MTFRPGPLRAAAALAAGFVAVRVVYRVLFHGADGSGVVLLPLPELRLPPPFAHVVMLGPVTLDGLWDAAASALPIALTILVFGLLNSLIDLHRVFARASRRGPLRGIARALAIAWATLPSLAEAARAVRFAQRLRGERGGVRMLAPLLQRTLERAGAVAAALELRGFAGRGLDGDCRIPVEADAVELGFGEIPDAAGHGDRAGSRSAPQGIRLPSLALEPGTLTLLSGATGSGKSTLLRAIAGLHTHVDGGWMSGTLRVAGHDRATVPPRDLAQRVGVVLQHPRDAFATERVRDEIGLALELRGVAPVIVAARVAEVAERVGVTELLDRPTRGLSAGEATLVAISAAIVEQPILLLVDEPLADLDADARVRVARLLDALAHEAGLCVVVAEHRVEPLAELADVRLRIDAGTVYEGSAGAALRAPRAAGHADPVKATGSIPPEGPARPSEARSGLPLSRDQATTTAPIVLRARDVTVRHRDAVAVSSASLDLAAGGIVALVGPNGAGKSSLIAAVALPSRDADIEAAGRVALVPDASDDLFVYDTVAAECARADRRAGRAGRRSARHDPRGAGYSGAADVGAAASTGGPNRNAGRSAAERPGPGGSAPLGAAGGRNASSPHARSATTAARFAGFLGLDPDGSGFAARLARHPRDLSVGERRCLALAIQLARDPAVLLVDEPTRGLDPAARALVWDALASLAAEGTAVLVASHEPEVARRADRVLMMRAGVLAPPAQAPAPPSDVLAASGTPDAPFTTPDERAPAPPHPRNSATSDPIRTRHPGYRAPAHARTIAPRLSLVALVGANLVALAAFCWPLLASAVPEQAHAAVPIAALALAPLAALVVVATIDGTVRSAHMLALLGTLAAIGAAVRIASTGVGGVEAVFILLILAGRAFGARFALLLGMATIALSSLLWGAIGPWTPFQMFACAWVGAVAGLLPRGLGPKAEIAMLCVYGVVASYVFGLLMNLWFWPFAVGFGTEISYDGAAPLGMNLSNFLLYSLVTSTLTWDTLRAITTVVGILVVGRAVLAAFRRAKPLTPHPGRPAASQSAASAGRALQ
ncbi:ATP-binding cassette domain-containing protein [Microbacterium allomyrinae]|uniref:ATP-binding cassette domain-containing protein n=1 Tax=Microbacterium allomyrinae TaxID=2830666 RepID=A0A9X1LTQ2_9MICO|nr:ATP-binding cassette domain-containing protein [Microbacterium allomyrinae]MCC2031310.1 ATP-binding cassette domain-containing protein [Microbacterium allomyrinae]